MLPPPRLSAIISNYLVHRSYDRSLLGDRPLAQRQTSPGHAFPRGQEPRETLSLGMQAHAKASHMVTNRGTGAARYRHRRKSRGFARGGENGHCCDKAAQPHPRRRSRPHRFPFCVRACAGSGGACGPSVHPPPCLTHRALHIGS